MVAAFRVALALLPLLSGAIVVKELPNSTDAKAVEQPQQAALIQEQLAIAANGSGWPGIPMLVELALTQIMDPVKDRLQTIRHWVVEQLRALDDGLSELKEKPGEALELFATKFTAIFQNVEEKLEPVRDKLSFASPAIEALKKTLQATGSAGAADTITNVMNAMSEKVIFYQQILSNCTEVVEGLRGLGQSDWHKAGPKVAELKRYLDLGAATLKSFGDSLQHQVEEALALLAGKLGIDANTLSPVLHGADDGWRSLEDSSSALAGGMATSSQSLPPQINLTVPDEGFKSGAPAAGALGALAAATAAALVL